MEKKIIGGQDIRVNLNSSILDMFKINRLKKQVEGKTSARKKSEDWVSSFISYKEGFLSCFDNIWVFRGPVFKVAQMFNNEKTDIAHLEIKLKFINSQIPRRLYEAEHISKVKIYEVKQYLLSDNDIANEVD